MDLYQHYQDYDEYARGEADDDALEEIGGALKLSYPHTPLLKPREERRAYELTEAGLTAVRYQFLAEHVRDVQRHNDGSFTVRYFRGCVVGTGLGANLDEAVDEARKWFGYRCEVAR
jgi:hypothetical protein